MPTWTMTRRPTHPGAILREDVLAPLALSPAAAARRFRLPASTLRALLEERVPVTAAIALRLARGVKGTRPEFWLGLQNNLDLWRARRRALAAA